MGNKVEEGKGSCNWRFKVSPVSQNLKSRIKTESEQKQIEISFTVWI